MFNDESVNIEKINEEDFKKTLIKILENTSKEEELFKTFKRLLAKLASHDTNNFKSETINQSATRSDQNLQIELKEMKNKILRHEGHINKLSNDNSDLKNLINEYDLKLKSKENTNTSLMNKLKQSEDKIINLQNAISISLEKENKLKKECELLKGKFTKEQEIYDIYKHLEADDLISLKGIFCGNSLEEFIYCGVQEKGIESLWEYIRIKALNGGTIDNLKEVFIFFFHAHNKIYKSPLYLLLGNQEGIEFDDNQHIRVGSDSRVAGKITQTIMSGYRNIITNKIVKKSLVKI